MSRVIERRIVALEREKVDESLHVVIVHPGEPAPVPVPV